MVKIKNLTKKYKNNKKITEINLNIADNGIYALIGLNGAGKSTLIKCLTTNIIDYNGEILIDNMLNKKKEAKKKITFLPEIVEPHYFLNGMEFVEYNVFLTKDEINKDYVYYLCDKLEFDKIYLKKPIKTYSKGMKQKISLIATFATDTKYFILDEPMSGLDPLARKKLKNLLLELKNNHSIFFASHILAEVNELADSVFIIHNGKIIFSGKTDEDLEEFFLSLILKEKE